MYPNSRHTPYQPFNIIQQPTKIIVNKARDEFVITNNNTLELLITANSDGDNF